jgi:hypothetical protein
MIYNQSLKYKSMKFIFRPVSLLQTIKYIWNLRWSLPIVILDLVYCLNWWTQNKGSYSNDKWYIYKYFCTTLTTLRMSPIHQIVDFSFKKKKKLLELYRCCKRIVSLIHYFLKFIYIFGKKISIISDDQV